MPFHTDGLRSSKILISRVYTYLNRNGSDSPHRRLSFNRIRKVAPICILCDSLPAWAHAVEPFL